MSRRAVLGAACLLLVGTAPHRIRAATEVEGSAYVGSTAGGWVCGPVGRANYAGAAARVRYSQEKARHGGSGAIVQVGVAAENERVEILDDDDGAFEGPGPPERTHFGASVRGGYLGPFARNGDSFGVELGAMVYEGWADPEDDQKSAAFFPDVELSYRPRSERFRVGLGLGSPTVTHYRRPGLYGGFDASAPALDLEVRLGVYRAGPALGHDAEVRGDVALLVPVSTAVSIRGSGSLMTGGDGGDGGGGELGLGVRAGF